MKPIFLLCSTALLLSGCIFEAPLVAENKLPIDAGIIGLWEEVPEEGKEPDEGDRLLILKFSETEYLIEESGLRYRAYPIELGGVRSVQLQLIGKDEGPMDWEGKTPTPFLVCSHGMKDGNLIVRALNVDLLGKDIKTTAALQEAFLKNKDKPDLFSEPGTYRRVKVD